MHASAGSPAADRNGILALLTRPSGWRRIRLFSASARAPHTRRRADLITLLVSLLAIAIVVPTARTTDDFEAALAGVMDQLPGFLTPLFAVAYDLLALWALICLVLVIVRRHWRLAGGLLLALPVSIGLTVLVNAGLGVDSGGGGLGLGAPIDGVPIQLVVAMALASLASREMSRPFRTLGRRIIVAGGIGALALPVSAPYRVLGGVLVAIAAASVVRYLLGSPLSVVTGSDVREDLAELGVDAEPVADWSAGIHEAVVADGRRIAVRVLGRDEWDNQLAVAVWRFLWYRKSSGRALFGHRQRIERQALLVLLAESRGAPVTPVVAAGISSTGDAVLATEVIGRPLASFAADELDDARLDGAWSALAALHGAMVAHGSVDGDAIRFGDDGRAVVSSFERAEALSEPTQVHADRAQLLVATAVTVGPERAIAAALRAVAADGEEATAPLVSFLQTAALDASLREEVAAADLSLEELRNATAEAAGIEEPELQKIWRVSWGALIRLGLLALLAYLVISQLADIGWSTIVDAVTSANPWLLGFALVFGQVPRVAQAASLQTAAPTPVPLGRVTRLQFATSFVNLAVPSTAARVAVSIRFFQRSGSTPGGAISAGALDGVAGFIAQISLLGGLLLAGFGTLGRSNDLSAAAPDTSDLLKLVAILLGAALLVIIVLACLPKVRAKVVETVHQLREALAVLRSPGRVVRLLAFNVLAELLFSTTIWIVLQAFGQDVAFADVVIINEAVALFSGLMPVPGGVGVTEAALTAGFTAVGVPEAIAFSAALCYRMCTFYLPPIWGYVAFNSLRKDGYL